MAEQRRWGGNPLRWCVLLLDALLRRASHYIELADHPDCLFRFQVKPSPRGRVLADGTQVMPGDPIIQLHLWNEHIPPMPEEGPDLAWAQTFYRRLRKSLRLLAQHVTTSSQLGEVKALYGRIFVDLGGRDPAVLMLRRLGFEFERVPDPVSMWARVERFFVTLYAGWLVWAYNPGSLKTKSIWEKDLVEVWMSRTRLLAMHGETTRRSTD